MAKIKGLGQLPEAEWLSSAIYLLLPSVCFGMEHKARTQHPDNNDASN